ncbi:MAG: hypothetical protein ACYDA8_22060 [Deferrisomatales bacterium]
MGGRRLRRLTSAALLALATWGAWEYLRLPHRAPPWHAAAPAAGGRAMGGHGADRPPAPHPGPEARGCAACHGPAPHRRDPVRRAFLNLHAGRLHCGVCHFTGSGLGVRRFAAAGGDPPGPLFAATRSGPGWEKAEWPTGGVALRPRGPACEQCHRRGSPILAAEGLYDDYRRRLLEDLAVLRRLGRGYP